ncbi:MAG: ABC transporter ATP-binding protein [Pseudomonadales bacterium]
MLEIHGLDLGAGSGVGETRCEFAAGSFNVVLGRNRSGKTALCRLLAGLPGPATGRVLLDGVDISALPAAQRPVALVNQAFVNYPHWTVARNIASPLIAAGHSRAEIAQQVASIAAQLQLEPLLERLPEQLSGGQQQRLAIGRALAKGARVLVMDEPLVNLDYKLREALETELAGLLGKDSVAPEQDFTLVYTTTDPRDALLLADQVLLLADSLLLQRGPVDLVYGAPGSRKAAELMSDPAVNAIDDDGWLVRPEHLSLTPRAADSTAFPVTVDSYETNGSQTYLHGQYQSRSGDLRNWIAKLPGMHRFDPGTQVTLHARSADLLCLPAAVTAAN